MWDQPGLYAPCGPCILSLLVYAPRSVADILFLGTKGRHGDEVMTRDYQLSDTHEHMNFLLELEWLPQSVQAGPFTVEFIKALLLRAGHIA